MTASGDLLEWQALYLVAHVAPDFCEPANFRDEDFREIAKRLRDDDGRWTGLDDCQQAMALESANLPVAECNAHIVARIHADKARVREFSERAQRLVAR